MLFLSMGLCACAGNTKETSVEASIETSIETSAETSIEDVTTTAFDDNSSQAEGADRVDEFEVSDDLQTVKLGRYEQDADEQNGTEQIEWIVLESDGQKALVISKNIIDCRPYNMGYAACNWESSSIRKWLNSEFLEVAFTEGERMKILETFVPDVDPDSIIAKTSDETSDDASGNDEDAIESVNETMLTGVYDKLFLLSDFEVIKYLPDDRAIEGDEAYAHATEYAIRNGVWVLTKDLFELGQYVDSGYDETIVGSGWWWLRNSEVSAKSIDVDSTGTIRNNGHDVGEKHDGVRPAMWISIE